MFVKKVHNNILYEAELLLNLGFSRQTSWWKQIEYAPQVRRTVCGVYDNYLHYYLLGSLTIVKEFSMLGRKSSQCTKVFAIAMEFPSRVMHRMVQIYFVPSFFIFMLFFGSDQSPFEWVPWYPLFQTWGGSTITWALILNNGLHLGCSWDSNIEWGTQCTQNFTHLWKPASSSTWL